MLMRLGHGISMLHQKQFSPLQLSGLQSFLDAQNLSSVVFSSGSGDNAPVSGWLDSSPKNNGFTNEGASGNFIYKASGLHGKPAIRKAVAQTSMISNNMSMYANAGTVIYIFTPLPARTTVNGPFGSLVSSFAYVTLSGSTITYEKNEANASVIGPAVNTSDVIITAVSFTSVSSAKLYVNNNAPVTFDPNNALTNNGGVRLGMTTAINSIESEFYGLLVFNRELSAKEIRDVYSWARRRYA